MLFRSDDLISTNAKIMKNVTQEVTKLSPEAIIIVVSNPLDAMCHIAFKTSGFPKNRVIEMAESILKDKKKILPCAAYFGGEYGISNLFIGYQSSLEQME